MSNDLSSAVAAIEALPDHFQIARVHRALGTLISVVEALAANERAIGNTAALAALAHVSVNLFTMQTAAGVRADRLKPATADALEEKYRILVAAEIGGSGDMEFVSEQVDDLATSYLAELPNCADAA